MRKLNKTVLVKLLDFINKEKNLRTCKQNIKLTRRVKGDCTRAIYKARKQWNSIYKKLKKTEFKIFHPPKLSFKAIVRSFECAETQILCTCARLKEENRG